MKNILFFTLLFALSFSGYSQKKEVLFNGKNLDNWTVYVKDTKISPSDFFYVKDGVIETPGVPMGYVRTNKEYSNYKLHLEWRWPETPTNSGVFIHVNGPDLLWPAHYQCQLKHGDAGDFVIHGVGEKVTVRDTIQTSSATVKPLVRKEKASSEKQAGKWNTLEVIARDNKIELWVNGVLQNTASNCSMTKGKIGMQAEGSRIQFRNIWVKQIKGK